MKRLSSRLETLGLGFALIFFFSSSTADATTITIFMATSNGGIDTAADVGSSPVTLFPLSIDTVEELEVQTGVYSAEFGREAAEVSVSTNGGTKYHRARFEFVRDNAFDSWPYLPASGRRDKASFKWNQQGATDIDEILDAGVQGFVGFDLNEVQNYGLLLNAPGYGAFLGNADKVHPGPCGASAGSIGLRGSPTCSPSGNSGATFFADKGAGNAFHCVSGNCHDADVIPTRATGDSVPVPEPGTMTLLVVGLAGLTAGRYGRAPKGRCRHSPEPVFPFGELTSSMTGSLVQEREAHAVGKVKWT